MSDTATCDAREDAKGPFSIIRRRGLSKNDNQADCTNGNHENSCNCQHHQLANQPETEFLR
jgi:hypothetical protein